LHAMAVARGKKFAIFETGAAFLTAYPAGPGKLAMFRGWWREAYSRDLRRRLPGLEMIVWFEFRKHEEGTDRDFRGTFDGMASELRKELDFSAIAIPGELGI